MDAKEIKKADIKDLEDRRCHLQAKYDSIGKESRAISLEIQERQRNEERSQ